MVVVDVAVVVIAAWVVVTAAAVELFEVEAPAVVDVEPDVHAPTRAKVITVMRTLITRLRIILAPDYASPIQRRFILPGMFQKAGSGRS
jgi:hypothetical protein